MEFLGDITGDPNKPSIFELVYQEQLRDLLQPALKYVLSVFAQRYPRYLLRLVNKHEEFYALLMLIVERHYLKTHGASFSENFYGLKRRRRPLIELRRVKAAIATPEPAEALRSADIRLSLAILVGLPYLKAKARDYYEQHGGGAPTELHTADQQRYRTSPLKNIFMSAYPWLNAFYEGWLLVYSFRYMFDKSPYYRPWLSWMKVDLRHLESTDFNVPLSSPPPRAGLKAILVDRLPRLLLESLKYLLPTAIFFIKFLEWWYSPSSPARALTAQEKGPQIPPPRRMPTNPNGLAINPTTYGECPICLQSIVNATALPSGYVFCYRCAYQEVEKTGRCPVSLMPTSVSLLRKVLW